MCLKESEQTKTSGRLTNKAVLVLLIRRVGVCFYCDGWRSVHCRFHRVHTSLHQLEKSPNKEELLQLDVDPHELD